MRYWAFVVVGLLAVMTGLDECKVHDLAQIFQSSEYSELFDDEWKVLRGERSIIYLGKDPSPDNCYLFELDPTGAGDKLELVLEQFRKLVQELEGELNGEYHEFIEMRRLKICFLDEGFPSDVFERVKWVNQIERDQLVVSAQIQEPVDWNLAYINSVTRPKNSFGFDVTGKGIDVYILDTEIQEDHPEFGGRVKNLQNVLGEADERLKEKCREHGTRVASLLGGTNVGVAKGCKMYGVQVLDCNGVGTVSDVIRGLSYVLSNSRPGAIINISLGGPRSEILNRAVSEAVKMGYIVVCAAGNEGCDACESSPGSSPDAVTVGSIDKNFQIPPFSNYGQCVDIFAPGFNIWTAKSHDASAYEGVDEMHLYSKSGGTSLSAPIVAGVFALMVEKNPGTSSRTIIKMVLDMAAKGKVRLEKNKNLKNSPNRVIRAPPFDASNNTTLVQIKELGIFTRSSEDSSSMLLPGFVIMWGFVVLLVLL